MDLSGLAVFVKYGSEYFFGKVPSKVATLLQSAGKDGDDEFRLSVSKQVVPVAASAEMNALIDDAYAQLSTDLVKLYKQYKSLDAKMEKEKVVSGVLSEAKQTELDNAKRIYERILSTVTSLADCLVKDVPVLEVCGVVKMSRTVGVIVGGGEG